MGAALVLVLVGLGALASGILIGRYYVPDDRLLRRTARHGRAYMRAVNHLIARDHDTVITELKKVVEENVEDVEPYFALGALFRGRGEHERAIRVHQALAVREGGSRRHRVRALYELGLDLRTAGMPRRAARAMEEVLLEEPRQEGAMRALCGLYEEQGRYVEAATVWQRLSKLRGEAPSTREHHLWIAAAQTAIDTGDLDGAKRLLKDARTAAGDRGESAHFFAAAAELAAARGNAGGARERLRQAIRLSPELTRYLAAGLVNAERALLAAVPDGARSSGPTAGAAPAAPGVIESDGDGDELDGDIGGAPPSSELATKALLPIGPIGADASQPDAPAAPLAPLAPADVTATLAAAATLAAIEAEVADRLPIALARADLLARVDADGAVAVYREIVTSHADLLPARVAAARLALAGGDPVRVRGELLALTRLLGWAVDGRWRCAHCSHRSPTFVWRCTSCRRWGIARVDLASEAPQGQRERRERPRGNRFGSIALPGEDGAPISLMGDGASARLPAPQLEHGLSASELAVTRSRPSLLGKVGGWFSGAWSGMRGKGSARTED